MTTLAEHMIVAGAENRPPILDKKMYNSWQSLTLLYIKGKKNGRMMFESIENGPLIYSTIEEDSQIHNKRYVELTKQEQIQDKCDVQETNIVFQGLLPDVQQGRMILESVENGPLLWPTVEENGVTRSKKYSELSTTEAIQVDCDVKATNIIL
nr:hypothetical protein [Tanacetum cinerariifolium]